jgi:hypothetical protein
MKKRCVNICTLLITANFSFLSRGMINQPMYYLHISLLPHLHKSSIIYYLTTTIKCTICWISLHNTSFSNGNNSNKASYCKNIRSPTVEGVEINSEIASVNVYTLHRYMYMHKHQLITDTESKL